MATGHPSRVPMVVGALLMLIGLVLLAGGCLLAAAGGSWFYILAALGFALSGALLWRRSASGLVVYAILLAAMLAWSLWEAGLDWWPLAARLDVVFVLALLLLLPPVTRPLPDAGRGRLALAAAVAISAVVAIVAGLRDPHDIEGTLGTADAAVPAALAASDAIPDGEWHAYGRTGYGQRYSPLAQITPDNVSTLQVAWQFRTGDVRGRPGDPEETTDEVTPLKIGNRLFLCTPHQSVIALDATNGGELWRYDPKIQANLALQHQTCRGVSYQPAPTVAGAAPAAGQAASATLAPLASPANDPAQPVAAVGAKTRGDCGAKLFLATSDGRLIAIDPESGAVCTRFGNGRGQVDLAANMPNLNPGSYYSTSPVVVTSRLVIVGGTVLDNFSTHEESGVIRAYDIDTGALVWNWDSGNPDATAPIAAGGHYTANSPNSWSISSVDEALGMVYVPMGNQPPDQWGGHRSAAVERF